jgi:hypothetical protein
MENNTLDYNYTKILEDCNIIINKYNPGFADPFKKNLQIYTQAKIIKKLIEDKNKQQFQECFIETFNNYANNTFSFLESTFYEICNSFENPINDIQNDIENENNNVNTKNNKNATFEQETQTNQKENIDFEIIN